MKSTKNSAASLLARAILWAVASAGLFGASAAQAAAGPAAPTVQLCSWDKPGRDPFVGDVVAAVDRYKDIPEAVRARLKQRMAERSYDEFVAIERDAIVGKHAYAAAIRDMHFGNGRICKTVTRANWTESMRERGMVYCEDNHCILVPTVCRNVSRITRLGQGAGSTGSAHAAGVPQAVTLTADNLDGLTDGQADGLPQGAADPLGAELADAGLPASVGPGAATFDLVASRSVFASGTSALTGNRSSGGIEPQSRFTSPFAGTTGGAGSGGVNPGGTELQFGPSPVPEAPAWMMMGVAAAFGLAARRRRAGR